MSDINLSDEFIDDIFGDSPFIHRRKIDKSGFEVVRQTNDDWRECMQNTEHVADFETAFEAETAARRMHVRWLFAEHSHRRKTKKSKRSNSH